MFAVYTLYVLSYRLARRHARRRGRAFIVRRCPPCTRTYAYAHDVRLLTSPRLPPSKHICTSRARDGSREASVACAVRDLPRGRRGRSPSAVCIFTGDIGWACLRQTDTHCRALRAIWADKRHFQARDSARAQWEGCREAARAGACGSCLRHLRHHEPFNWSSV